ncbi:MAG: hypothetical protein CL609_02500 [Anaerolineaceae bacterium]|nr:hypothetical protein [Anaerolineaceae bacterium]
MAQTVLMPRFGATMEEGTITYWAVSEGDTVQKGDLLGEIEIEKLSNELYADQDGTVLKLIAEIGVAVPCGEPILFLGEPGEAYDGSPKETEVENKETKLPESHLNNSVKQDGLRTTAITPKAKLLAEELEVDYTNIVGTGRMGMITRDDIRNALNKPISSQSNIAETQNKLGKVYKKMNQIEVSIARSMDNSLKTTAQTTISIDFDASHLVDQHNRLKREYQNTNIRPTYTVLFIKIVALALVEHPVLRTSIENEYLVTSNEINIGVAMDIPRGLVVPNIKNAHLKSLPEISKELNRLQELAKQNALQAEDISNGTFTITNLGMFGIKYFTPVLNPGESGILGIGTLQEIPRVLNGGIFITPTINLSLTHDHRVVNGAPAARFLQSIQRISDTILF